VKFDGFSTPVICFRLICTTRRWDRGAVWGHTLFISELNFFSIHAKTHFFSRSRPSFDSRCEPCIVPQKIVNVCWLPILWETHIFFDRLKRLVVVQILEVTVYQENAEHIRLITFHWQSEKVEMWGDLFGRAKIDTSKSCIQLLQIVLLYRGHLHKEFCPGIFRYSKGWKSSTINIVPKSAWNTHLTAEPILKQSAVYVSQSLIASKPGSSPPRRPGLDNITSQPWSDATCPRRTSDSAYFPFVSKTKRQSTKSGSTGAGWVRPWLTRGIV